MPRHPNERGWTFPRLDEVWKLVGRYYIMFSLCRKAFRCGSIQMHTNVFGRIQMYAKYAKEKEKKKEKKKEKEKEKEKIKKEGEE